MGDWSPIEETDTQLALFDLARVPPDQPSPSLSDADRMQARRDAFRELERHNWIIVRDALLTAERWTPWVGLAAWPVPVTGGGESVWAVQDVDCYDHEKDPRVPVRFGLGWLAPPQWPISGISPSADLHGRVWPTGLLARNG